MPPPATVPLNATRRFTVKFRTRNADQSPGALTNPAAVTLKIENPNGAITTVTYPTGMTRPTTGIYYVDHALNLVGLWKFRWNGDGSVQEGQVQVRASDMG